MTQIDGKESTCNAGDRFNPGLGRSPGGGHGNRPSILAWRIPWTEQPVGYSPWGQKESDMTEQLTHGGGKKMWLHNLADTFFFMESRARASLFPNSNLKNNSCFPG